MRRIGDSQRHADRQTIVPISVAESHWAGGYGRVLTCVNASHAARCVACHGCAFPPGADRDADTRESALTRASRPYRLRIVEKRSSNVPVFRLLGRGVF